MTGLIEISLSCAGAGATCVLDAARLPDGRALVSFAHGVDPARLTLPDGATIAEARSIGGATQVLCSGLPDRAVLTVDGTAVEVWVTGHHQDAFAGTDALVGARNGEPAATALDWLRFHVAQHGASSAVILDRARPGSDPAFAAGLRAGIEGSDGIDGLAMVAIVSCDRPLGKPDHPPEAHPLCVAEAPGKDRIAPPPPDPWAAPLGAPAIFEIVRHRALGRARAVAHLDVHDLLTIGEGPTAFQLAADAPSGVIRLIGRHAFPWRVRPGQAPCFGDHVCIQFDAPASRRRWCLAPATAPDDAIWRMVRIGNAAPDRRSGRRRFIATWPCGTQPCAPWSRIVPKTSLVEHRAPARAGCHGRAGVTSRCACPRSSSPRRQWGSRSGRRAIVTTHEERGALRPRVAGLWHRAIGFDDVLVYTNDCTDGTDAACSSVLQDRGLVQHRANPYREAGLKPQHAALQAAEDEPAIREGGLDRGASTSTSS